MSRALISSSAASAVSLISSTCIRILIELIRPNIIENPVRKQIASAVPTFKVAPDLGGRNRQRRSVRGVYAPAARTDQVPAVHGQPHRGLSRQRSAHAREVEV